MNYEDDDEIIEEGLIKIITDTGEEYWTAPEWKMEGFKSEHEYELYQKEHPIPEWEDNGFESEYDYELYKEKERIKKELLAEHDYENVRLIDGIDLERNIFTNHIDNTYEFWGNFFNRSFYYPMSIEPDIKKLPVEQMTIKFISHFNIKFLSYYLMYVDAEKELYINFLDEECITKEYGEDRGKCFSCSRENWSEKCDELFRGYLSREKPSNKYFGLDDSQIESVYNNITDKEIYLMREFPGEYGGFKLLVMLLMIRVEQLSDSIAFYLLTEIEYHGYYDFGEVNIFTRDMAFGLLLLFLQDPIFFIKQSIKYKAQRLFGSFAYYFAKVFTPEYFFLENQSELKIKLKSGQLFVYPPDGNPNWLEYDYEYSVTDKLKQILAQQPTEPAFFIPIKTEKNLEKWKSSFPTWQEGIINFPNFGDYWGKNLLSQLTEGEKTIYNDIIYHELKKKLIRNYHVNSELGFAYLKEKPNNESDTLRVIANDEYVCFLEDDSKEIRYEVEYKGVEYFTNSKCNILGYCYKWQGSGWVKVHYQQGDNGVRGYIHTSQLEQR